MLGAKRITLILAYNAARTLKHGRGALAVPARPAIARYPCAVSQG
jgi:hypothetical protein